MVITIIGGGFSGALAAAQLLARAARSRRAVTLRLIERRGTIGLGVAYSTWSGEHLLNVVAAKMSAYPDEPRHFVDWLRANEFEFADDAFVPRKIYGAYLQDILRTAEGAALGWGQLERIHGDAVALEKIDGGWRVSLKDGRMIFGDRVILALGNPPPSNAAVASTSLPENPLYVADPWRQGLPTLDPGSAVMLIGTGLTAVDMVVTLKERGHRGLIHAVSRHGLWPQPHRLEVAAGTYSFDPRNLASLLNWFRTERRGLAAKGGDWRSALDGLRPHTQKLWSGLSVTERQRFLRHARSYWDVHRHRLAPSIADVLENARRSGQLVTHAGRIESSVAAADGVSVTLRRRGSGTREAISVCALVNCTGPASDVRRLHSPLISDLLARGYARPHPVGLGLEIPPSFASELLLLGTLRSGEIWETVAVPELRVQAQHAAELLLFGL